MKVGQGQHPGKVVLKNTGWIKMASSRAGCVQGEGSMSSGFGRLRGSWLLGLGSSWLLGLGSCGLGSLGCSRLLGGGGLLGGLPKLEAGLDLDQGAGLSHALQLDRQDFLPGAGQVLGILQQHTQAQALPHCCCSPLGIQGMGLMGWVD
ncbi:hypothetical protein HaLaN_10000 [Haematococcus lacustris]|uniref:Uncharacterized protein n=1 Tax=Haematococcus lacustris TaxID=44745 RepID=A0A699YUV8_HAELA|nr:hypothetical protein HaLaN_10000 [Haematococcus lacustris]